MNELLAPVYEFFFNWDVHQILLNIVFDNGGYEKISWSFLIIPIVLFGFYKLWDPIQSPKMKWFLSLIIISIIMYLATSLILYNDFDIKDYIGNYSADTGDVNPDYFIFKMSIVSSLIGFVSSIILSVIPFRLISSSNRHNPF